MNLIIQFESIVMSFLYGIFISFVFNLLYNFLFTKYFLLNVISNLLFSLLMFGLYYILLFIVNEGVIHIYFIGTMFMGFIIYNKIFVKLRVKLPKTRLN